MFGQSPSPSFSVRPHPSQEALTLSVGLAAADVEAGTATYNCRIFLTNSHFYVIYTRHSFTSTMSSITFTLQQRHLLINTVLATQQGCSGLRGRKPKARKFPYWIATLSQACTKKKAFYCHCSASKLKQPAHFTLTTSSRSQESLPQTTIRDCEQIPWPTCPGFQT